MKKELTAKEAADILGVTPATLYAYVSRGLLSSAAEGGARSKRYAHEDVLRLAARKADGKRAGHAASGAMHWGVPVLESRLTLIADGRLYYRGHDSGELATHATLEETAAILWGEMAAQAQEHTQAAAAEPAFLPQLPPQARALSKGLAPLERAIALLPLLARQAPDASPLLLMRMVAAVLLDVDVSAAPLHEQAARAFGISGAGQDVLRAMLVLLADHELNTSAFTVRCVASTGASASATLCAGLAALSGHEHGGEYLLVKQAMQAALASPGGLSAMSLQPMQHGFGHPLYPKGDPRAVCLLAHMRQAALPGMDAIQALAQRAYATPGAEPTVDFALAALEIVLNLPTRGVQALFALARTAGWLAHAAEQRAEGQQIRPRARYVGKFVL